MQEKRSILEADGYFIKLKLVVEFFIFQRNDIANRKIAIAKTEIDAIVKDGRTGG